MSYPGHGTYQCVHGHVLGGCKCMFASDVIHLAPCPVPSTPAHDAVVTSLVTGAPVPVETRTEAPAGAGLGDRIEALTADLSAFQIKLNQIRIEVEEMERRS